MGPVAWGAAQLSSYAATPLACGSGSSLLPLAIHAIALAAALAGGGLSLRASRAPDAAQPTRSARFVAHLGIAAALLFGLAIVLQGAADLVHSACER
ncbi:hypothetical protein [Hansschlegelia sp.]|uniref:hypothetical protein n=1 Tax=Hansschlegelia sp. TaxID=2041892 RepID=UPI002C13C732|nr:hypothetical protein [Hansschlegelia sp.]HVI28663.1 hypothetical protein [Hansschlegelia sp.]